MCKNCEQGGLHFDDEDRTDSNDRLNKTSIYVVTTDLGVWQSFFYLKDARKYNTDKLQGQGDITKCFLV